MLEAVRAPATYTGAVEIEFASGKECRLEACVTRPCMGLPAVTASGRCFANECCRAQQRRAVEHRKGRW